MSNTTNKDALSDEEVSMKLVSMGLPVSLDLLETVNGAFGGLIKRDIPDTLFQEGVGHAQVGRPFTIVGHDETGFRLVGDPDSQNADRSHNALMAVTRFAQESFCDHDTAVRELLAGLMHYCSNQPVGFEQELADARDDYAFQTELNRGSECPAMDDAQFKAITEFAENNGRDWKEKLGQLWESGRDERQSDRHLLRQVRNQFGPEWLESFVLPKADASRNAKRSNVTADNGPSI